MSETCPSCGGYQPQSLLCADDTAALETMLAAVPQLIDQLQVAIGKQARISTGGKGGKGTAREQNPINFGALAVRDALLVELALWGDDITAIRRHPQAAEIVSGIGRAVKDAYRAIDRLQERQYLGQCLHEENELVCHAEVWVRPGAHQITCSQCDTVHLVFERRAELLEKAEDLLCTVKEASRYMGEVGHVVVTEASIRGYLHRGRIVYRAGKLIRLGDLLDVVQADNGRKSA